MTRDLYVGDNLPVLRGLDSETVDFVYLDPPFNSNRSYAAPIASGAAGQRFDDTWRWDTLNKAWLGEIDDRNEGLGSVIHTARRLAGDGTAAYLSMMGVRLLELERVLRPGGAIFLHCDDTAGHHLKLCMDAVFGADGFRNDIVWRRTRGRSDAKRFGRVKDNILFYRKRGGVEKWRAPTLDHDPDYVAKAYRHVDRLGRWRAGDLTASGTRDGESGKPWRGVDPGTRGNHWRTPTQGGMSDFIIKRGLVPGWPMPGSTVQQRLDALDKAGLVHWPVRGHMPRLKRYLDSTGGAAVDDLITDIRRLNARAKEKTGWPTQKPVALVARLIEATTDEGDLVLDPFAGCATACVAAEILKRSWIGIDIDEAVEVITLSRLDDETEMARMATSDGGWGAGVRVLREPPVRSDRPKGRGARQVQKARWKKGLKNRLYGKQKGLCNGCRKLRHMRELTYDHVIPTAKGGLNIEANMQLLCSLCNSIKGTDTMEILWERLKNLRQEEDRDLRKRIDEAAAAAAASGYDDGDYDDGDDDDGDYDDGPS